MVATDLKASFWKVFIVVVLYITIVTPSIASDDNKPTFCSPPSWMPKSVPSLCEWETTTSIPSARTFSSSIVYAGSIYVAGGYQWNSLENTVKYYDDIIATPIGKNGALGNWKKVGAIHNGRTGLGMAAANNCVYIVGGSWSSGNSVIYGDDVQVGRFDNKSDTLQFTESQNHLKTPRSNISLAVYQGRDSTYLYAVAGVTQLGDDTVHLDSIEYAAVDTACNVGPWTKANFDLKGGRGTAQAFVIGEKLYVLGGWGDLDLVDIYNDVQFTTIKKDGAISPWQTASNKLPTGIYGHTANAIPVAEGKGVMLLISGGQPSTGIYSNGIAYAYMDEHQLPSGTTGPWASFFKMLPQQRAGHSAVFKDGYLYLIGGSQAGGVYLKDVIFTSVSPGEIE